MRAYDVSLSLRQLYKHTDSQLSTLVAPVTVWPFQHTQVRHESATKIGIDVVDARLVPADFRAVAAAYWQNAIDGSTCGTIHYFREAVSPLALRCIA